MSRIATFVCAALAACALTDRAQSQTAVWVDGYPTYGYFDYPVAPGYDVSSPPGYAYSPDYSYLSYEITYPSYSLGISFPWEAEGYYANRGYPYRRWAGDRSVVFPNDPGVIGAP